MQAVKYNEKNLEVVKAFEALPPEQQKGSFWSEPDVDPVREEVKDYYIGEQKHRCVYCNVLMPTNNKSVWDAEHIISRSLAPAFLFEPRNLAVSCRDCNIAKGESEVRNNPNRKSFPDKSEHYLIVHPHFDDYEEHIRWFGPVCAPNGSVKGQNTIEMCNLMRFAGQILGIESKIVSSDFDDLIGKLISSKSNIEILANLAALKVLAENIPQD